MQMGERFDRFLEFVVDYVFSPFTLVIIIACGLVYGVFKLSEVSSARREEHQAKVEYCYSQNMVLVHTDAGERCVEPSSLVRVK